MCKGAWLIEVHLFKMYHIDGKVLSILSLRVQVMHLEGEYDLDSDSTNQQNFLHCILSISLGMFFQVLKDFPRC